MANGKGMFRNFYSCWRRLPSNVTVSIGKDYERVFGIVTDEFYNFGQRIAAKSRNENAKFDFLKNSPYGSDLRHTYAYYWCGDKTDGIKEGLFVFYRYEFGRESYVRMKTHALTWAQLEKLEKVVQDWHIKEKLIINDLGFPVEFEVI